MTLVNSYVLYKMLCLEGYQVVVTNISVATLSIALKAPLLLTCHAVHSCLLKHPQLTCD